MTLPAGLTRDSTAAGCNFEPNLYSRYRAILHVDNQDTWNGINERTHCSNQIEVVLT